LAAASLLAPAAHDQVPAALAHAQTPGSAALDRVPVRVSHALDSTQAIEAAPKPFIAQSREFWVDVGATELRGGVKLHTTAPGALIRLSPQGGAGAALDPAGVLIRGNGNSLRADEASAAIANTSALRSAGMDVPAGTLALRLSPAAGSGELEIAAPHAQGRYLVHVLDHDSTLVLGFGADRDTVLVGSTITFRATLTGLKLASGLVSAPDGYGTNLKFVRNADGTFSATFTPDAAHAVGPQLWEAHVFTAADVGKLTVLRDAKTAFAVSAPTARFAGGALTHPDGSGLHVTLDIDAGAASRYQIGGVLYGTGSDGAVHAVALGQSAAWLDAGKGQIELSFDADIVAASGLHAPFEVRDLRLTDQANMSLVERRERALVIGD
jgi:hypothetical protein